MQAMITVTGIQHIDGDTDKIQLTTEGEWEVTADGYTVRYAETAATGMENTQTVLHITPHKVTLERVGVHAGLLVLEHKKRHMCNYATPVGNIMLGVYTEALQQSLSDTGGRLYLCYTLDVGGRLMSRQELYIQIT